MSARMLATMSLLISLSACVAAAQSVSTRKEIPTIAKAANGAIVTIVMANGDKPIAQGTGFFVSPDGVIVTNYHVIAKGNVAVVKFSDGTALPVEGVLAADKVRDLAIIKIHAKNFRTLTLGDSDRVRVGEEVVAIGNPLGLELTVSNGILSGVRTVEKEGGKFLQITAPISHGSSGGPLFNMAGEVVGITSMYFAGGENLNFAIPVNDAKRLLLNQSTMLQHLPNEPQPEETQPEETHKNATLSEQKMCSEQSDKVLQESKKRNFLPANWGSISHYDASTATCYVEISRRLTDDHGEETVREFWVEDAFGGGNAGWFIQSFPERFPNPSLCKIQPPGRSEMNCKSLAEFDDLVRKYFGITR